MVKNLSEKTIIDPFKLNENAIICGYSLKELILFANACRREGIEEKDLKDFCDNATYAYNYIFHQAEKSIDDMIGVSIVKEEKK